MNSKDVSYMTHEDAVKIIKNTNDLVLLLEYSEQLRQDFQKFLHGNKMPLTIKLFNNSLSRKLDPYPKTNKNEKNNIEYIFEPLTELRQFIIK